jgi:hypothetical protein
MAVDRYGERRNRRTEREADAPAWQMVEREGHIRSVVTSAVMAANDRLPAAWQLLTAWHLHRREPTREPVASS